MAKAGQLITPFSFYIGSSKVNATTVVSYLFKHQADTSLSSTNVFKVLTVHCSTYHRLITH